MTGTGMATFFLREDNMTTLPPGRGRAFLALILLLAALAAPLAGCGKKGAPSPPKDEPNTFPRSYPRE
jgi:predicted small lipoprotein YifL